MPRDLFPPPVDEHFLTASPEPQEALSDDDEQDLHMQLSRGQIPPAYARAIFGGGDPDDRDQDRSNSARRNDDLHPLVQNLSISDLDACIALENAAFPPNERCSREKVPSLALSLSYPLSFSLSEACCDLYACLHCFLSTCTAACMCIVYEQALQTQVRRTLYPPLHWKLD
jgi:hypothetical protein